MPKQYYIIGSPVSHSLSPHIYNWLFEHYSIKDSLYSKKEVTPKTLEEFVLSIPRNNVHGFNITMPLKSEILPYLSQTDETVFDSVNTVVVHNGTLFGSSTDARGFYRALGQLKFKLDSSHIVFLGAGSVTAPLVQFALKHSAASITILNRTLEHAQKLCTSQNINADLLENKENYMKNCDLLVNTTPLGMSGSSADFANFSFLETLPPSACVCDLIYNPSETNLLKAASSLGLRTQNGLPMLIWQAFYAFEKYTGILPSQKEFDQLHELLNQ